MIEVVYIITQPGLNKVCFPDLSIMLHRLSLFYEGVWAIRPPAPGPHKSFNKRNFLLVKVQSLWSRAHYFQWFTGYLNHIDLLMSHVHVLKKLLYRLMFSLSCFVDFVLCPTNKYMLNVNNKKFA